MKSRTQSRWRFKRPAATHDLLIHFVRRADRLQYYDCAALCSTGRSLRELSTALKICWTLSAPSNRISGKILHGAYRRAGAHVQGARSFVRQCRTRCKCAPATERRTFVLSPRGSQVADIFVQCPRTGTPISTGLRTEWVLLNSLPRVPIPVRCPACGQMHKWDPQHAWIGPVLQSRAPRRHSGSRAASWSTSASDDEKTHEFD